MKVAICVNAINCPKFAIILSLCWTPVAAGGNPYRSAAPSSGFHLAAHQPAGTHFSNIADNVFSSADSWTSPDKFDHLLGSAMLSSGGVLAMKATHNDNRQSFVLSIASVAGLGVLKEFYDAGHPNQQSSWKDLLYDVVGAAVGAAIARSL